MIRIWADDSILDNPRKHNRPKRGISFIFNTGRRVKDRAPTLVFHHAAEENIYEIVGQLRDKGLVKNDRVVAANGLVELCSFTVLLGTLKTLRPIIIQWIKARKRHKIEVQHGKTKVRASNLRELEAVFALLEKHKSAGVLLKKPQQSKKSTTGTKGNGRGG